MSNCPACVAELSVVRIRFRRFTCFGCSLRAFPVSNSAASALCRKLFSIRVERNPFGYVPQPIWLRARMTLKGRRASCPRRLGRLDKQPYGQTAGALRERTSRARVQCCAASQAARAPGALTLVRRRQTRTTIARGGAALSGPSRPPPDWAKPPSQPPPELPELRRRRARRPPPARPRHPRCSAAADP